MDGEGRVSLENVDSIYGLHFFDYPVLYKSSKELFVYNDLQYKDLEWYDKQLKYIESLSLRQKEILNDYTENGDIIVNNYLRGTLTPKMLNNILEHAKGKKRILFKYQHADETGNINIVNTNTYKRNIDKYIQSYINELKEIIENAPPLDKPAYVFRGVKESTHIEKSLKKNSIENVGFLSTSMNIESAMFFADATCCIMEIYVPKDTHCLFIAPVSRRAGEFEIIFMPNTHMKLIDIQNKYILDNPEYYTYNKDIILNYDKYLDDSNVRKVYTFNLGS